MWIESAKPTTTVFMWLFGIWTTYKRAFFVCWKRNALIHILQAILCLCLFLEEPAAPVFGTEEVGSFKTLTPMYQTTGHGMPDG
jgi:hypothetical protein